MADRDLRQLEAEFEEHTPESIRARLRTGTLGLERVQAAARLGNEAAALALDDQGVGRVPDTRWELVRDACALLPRPEQRAWACDCLGRARVAWNAERAEDDRLETAIALAADPERLQSLCELADSFEEEVMQSDEEGPSLLIAEGISHLSIALRSRSKTGNDFTQSTIFARAALESFRPEADEAEDAWQKERLALYLLAGVKT